MKLLKLLLFVIFTLQLQACAPLFFSVAGNVVGGMIGNSVRKKENKKNTGVPSESALQNLQKLNEEPKEK